MARLRARGIDKRGNGRRFTEEKKTKELVGTRPLPALVGAPPLRAPVGPRHSLMEQRAHSLVALEGEQSREEAPAVELPTSGARLADPGSPSAQQGREAS